MRETWYVLEDGTSADPNEVAPDDAGVLRHKDGLAVAVGPHGHLSRGVNVEDERARAIRAGEISPNSAREMAGLPAIEAPSDTKDMQAEKPRRAYKRRDVTAG